MTSTPFFSVIIPAYNAERFIEKTLDSVRQQTFQDFELIVVDDGSKDQTAATTEDFLKRYSMRGICIRQKNRKIAGARNTGIRSASSSWIALLDHDDQWNAQKLEKVVEKIREFPNAQFIVHEAEVIYAGNSKTSQKILLPRGLHNMHEHLLFRGNPICTSAVVFKKPDSECGKMFSEDEELFTVEDLDYWIHLAAKFRFSIIHEPLASIHWHEKNASADRILHSENYSIMICRHLKNYKKNKSIIIKIRTWMRIIQVMISTFLIKIKYCLKTI